MTTTCVHCGNNPVPHRLTWFGGTLGIFMRQGMDTKQSKLQVLSAYLATRFFPHILGFFRMLGFARFSADKSTVLSARAGVLWEEADARGIEMHNLVFLGRVADIYRACINNRHIYFSGLPRPAYTESGSDRWLDDKAILKQKLAAAGVPVPRGGSFTRFGPMLAMFGTLQKPVVVKPRTGSRGRHTTTHIYTKEELVTAYKIAKQLCHYVVLEEHLSGSVYRATAIDGVLAGVLQGDPPRVTGDGVRSIGELVTDKNKEKNPRVWDVILTGKHKDFLRRTGKSASTIPAAGEIVDLSEAIGVRSGGHSAEVGDVTHPETKRILKRAAAVVADPIIGFDFIIPDITASPEIQKWGIIECNSTPFINLHHDPLEGTPVNVAARVWDYVDANIERF